MKKSVSRPAKKRKPSLPKNTASKPRAIVGIGASAGGLEAFKKLLGALPAHTGVAFVFVQHMHERQESVLTKLFRNVTEMPVIEVRENVTVEADHVYVMTPATDLEIVDGVLHVLRRKGRGQTHLPIDQFFSSLAADQGPRAIGVVLSGTASDGTVGLKSIRVEGGITFAQAPETAKFDGMPANAIMSGSVDFVLAPEAIAAKLIDISRQPYVEPDRAIEPALGHDEEWAQLFKLLKGTAGVDFSFYKKNSLRRRVARRMTLHKADRLRSYLKLLESNNSELEALRQDILIHVTSFFREPDVFLAFQRRILPRLLRGKKQGEPIRIWIAGCSTGEEVYSLAICVLEGMGQRKSVTPLMIFGTDVSEEAVEKARAGVYPASALTNIAPDRVRRFFTKLDGHYQINSNVRDLCVFARHDLTRDPPFSRLDIVSCRNVLIYFEPVLQKRVLTTFHYALKDSGFLLMGKSETLGSYTELFSTVDSKNKFFAKKPTAAVAYDFGPSLPDRFAKREVRVEFSPIFDLEKEADRLVWERYAHSGVVVDNDLQIVQFRGDTAHYVRPMPGKATFHLLRMLRDELVFEVRAAVHKVRRTGTSVRRDPIRLKINGTSKDIIVEVMPITGSAKRDKHFLVLFEEARSDGENVQPVPRPAKADRREIDKLKSELARTREYLQAIVQEQETTNEELKTANEEALSSMEELQSSNEELETAKEELQSSNEELVTLNEQLQNRSAELARSNDDLNSVLSSVNIPMLILTPDRRIRTFTHAAEKLLNLIPGDIGRTVRAKRLGFEISGLDEMVSTVMTQGIERQQDAQSENGRWYSVRLFPYRTADQKIEGALLAFVDIDDLRKSREALVKQIDLTTAILNAANDLLVLVRDPEGRIVRFNQACQRLTGYSEDEVQGRYIWEFLVPMEFVKEAKADLQLANAGTARTTEQPWLARDGRRILISWSTTFTKTGDSIEYILGAGIDITERQEAAEQIREKEATVRALLEAAEQAIVAIQPNGKIILTNAAAERIFGYTRNELSKMSIKTLLPKRNRSGGHYWNEWFSHPEAWSPENRELAGLRKDGSHFPVEVSFSQIKTKTGMMNVCFISDISQRKEYESMVRSMTTQLLSMQEQTSRTIARELHDDISQKLAALSMEAGTLLKREKALPEPLVGHLRVLGKKIGSLTEDVHRMSRQLHPKILDDLGLEVAIREECLALSRQMGLSVEFDSRDVPRSVPENTALCLFRVTQEGLRNIAKHSKAGRVGVTLSRTGKDLLLLIEDDGDGFDLGQARTRRGLGLVSMEERVRLAEGKFNISSQPGVGTQIQVYVPLPEKL
jgi:two-component system, chemotaxis family, CheB/CheR fusion protein